jgi:hypothetical protein
MTDSRRAGRRRWPSRILGVALISTPVAGYLATSGGAGRAIADGEPSASSLYPALSGTAPLGLTLSSGQATAATAAQQPVWRTPPGDEGNRPVPQSIRRLPATDAQLNTWIADSTTGGICVLLSPARQIAGMHPIGATCTDSAPARLQEGTFLSYRYPESSEIALAGVVPASTVAMRVAFVDGTTQTVAVDDGAWSLQGSRAPVSVTSLPQGVTQQIGGE